MDLSDLSSSSEDDDSCPSESSDITHHIAHLPVDVMATIRAIPELEQTTATNPKIVAVPENDISNVSSLYDSDVGSSVDPPSLQRALTDQASASINRSSKMSSTQSASTTLSNSRSAAPAIYPQPSDSNNIKSSNVPSSAMCLHSSAKTSLQTIGGTVSSNTRKITGGASRDGIMEALTHVLTRAQGSYGTRMESNEHQLNIFFEQNFVQNPNVVNVGGQVIVNPEGQKTNPEESEGLPNAEQTLRGNTERRLKKWTEGMVQTEGFKEIMKKLDEGKTLIVVTGSPGEGKTTAVYLALKQLSDMGRQVYDIQSPEDYFKTKDSKECILMLDDIFGALHFDQLKVSRWEEVLADLLKMKEHTNEEETGGRSKRPKRVVLMICRSTVLNEASHHLGRYKDLMLDTENIIDFTHGIDLSFDSLFSEKMDIWKSHASKYDVDISEDILNEVCAMPTPHGFPHCCRLFADMRGERKTLDMIHFFKKPLEFLHQTMESLMANEFTGKLLRELIRNNGCLDLNCIEDDEKRFQYARVLKRLSGSYLFEDEGRVMFHHPSVYDSAAFVVCENDPLYVIKYCTMSFLNDRLMFEGLQSCFQNETHKRLTIGKRYIKPFIQRLKTEIIKGESLAIALSHLSLNDAGFASGLMECICESTTVEESLSSLQHVTLTKDRKTGQSFLFLMTKSQTDKILIYICEKLDLSVEDLADILFGACEDGSVSSIQYFIQKYTGFDFNVGNERNETPLVVAAKKQSSKMLNLLMSTNVDVTKVDKYGTTALHNICKFGVDNEDVVKKMIEKGMVTNSRSQHFPSLPLAIASYEGHKNVVAALLDCGAEVDLTYTAGYTPLYFACMMNHLDVVILLLDRGADMLKAYNFYESLILSQSKSNHAGIVEELIKRGANPHYDSSSGEYPLYWACFNFSINVIKVLIDAGADVNVFNKADTSPFLDTCAWGRESLVAYLLERGADVNKADDFSGIGPLHMVAVEGHSSLVKLLVKNGARVNQLDKSGATALFRASNKATVLELFRRGADVNVTDNRGNTALHFACSNRNEEVALALLQDGADINVKNKKGRTAFDAANKWGNSKVKEAILMRKEKEEKVSQM